MDDVAPTTLVRYDAMRSAIVAAHSIDEVKDIRDKAIALELYARQANDMSLERQVHEIRVRAERRVGQLLREVPKATPRGSNQHEEVSRGPTLPKTLTELGVTRDQSSLWQKAAAIPNEEFEAELANPGALPSTAQIVAAHEAKTAAPTQPSPPIDDRALWLCARLEEFEHRGLLDADPNDLVTTMADHMKKSTRKLAPRVATWLERIKP